MVRLLKGHVDVQRLPEQEALRADIPLLQDAAMFFFLPEEK